MLGEKEDIRQIPSIVGGDQEKRHGIVLVKSTPAKKYGIQTGEPIVATQRKCPGLVVVPPDYGLYVTSFRAFIKILNEYSDKVHTLFPEEIGEKMWPLLVSDLFLCGRATVEKLHRLGIQMIGELAEADKGMIRAYLKKQG